MYVKNGDDKLNAVKKYVVYMLFVIWYQHYVYWRPTPLWHQLTSMTIIKGIYSDSKNSVSSIKHIRGYTKTVITI